MLVLLYGRMERLLLRKLRRATMLSGNLRSASKAAHLILTLRSNLGVVDCWPAYLLAQVNVAEQMGKLKQSYRLFLF